MSSHNYSSYNTIIQTIRLIRPRTRMHACYRA